MVGLLQCRTQKLRAHGYMEGVINGIGQPLQAVGRCDGVRVCGSRILYWGGGMEAEEETEEEEKEVIIGGIITAVARRRTCGSSIACIHRMQVY